METDWLLLKAAVMGGSLSRLTHAKELVYNFFFFLGKNNGKKTLQGATSMLLVWCLLKYSFLTRKSVA